MKNTKKEASFAQLKRRKRRCIGFDWRMSQHDCEHLKRNGMIPSFTKSCGYSNSGTLARATITPWPDKISSLNLYSTYLDLLSVLFTFNKRCENVEISEDQVRIFWEKRCKRQNASNFEKRFDHLMIFGDKLMILK